MTKKQHSKKFTKKALAFYEAFPPGFLKELEAIAGSLELSVQSLIVAMLLKVNAFDYGWLTVFGSQPPNFLSEIRYDEKGKLIEGPELLQQLTQEAIDHLKEVRSKLESSVETKKAVVISKKSMAVFQECLL